ncbi:MAG: hypothetical protein LBP87_12860 [Planctomycetaceae bacterium]|jgi:cell division protein FtsL|nr:hypothetical protein [Planctomycetaceae bacterium]
MSEEQNNHATTSTSERRKRAMNRIDWMDYVCAVALVVMIGVLIWSIIAAPREKTIYYQNLKIEQLEQRVEDLENQLIKNEQD